MKDEISQIVAASSKTLRDAGIDVPEYEAKVLLAFALSWSFEIAVSLSDIDSAIILGKTIRDFGIRADSQQAFDEIFDEAFAKLISRRASREPLQYILGTAPFRYLELDVGPGVFIPRPETELLVDEVLKGLIGRDGDGSNVGDGAEAHERRMLVVDLCAGTGAVGLSVLTEANRDAFGAPVARRVGDVEVFAVEKSPQAFEWLQRNAAKVLGYERHDDENGDGADDMLASRFHPLHADALDSSTLSELDKQVDIVVSNPPYVPLSEVPEQPEVGFDPDMALYGGSDDGLRIPEGIVVTARRLLKPGGLLVMEHDWGQSGALTDYCQRHGFDGVRAHRDLAGRFRYLSANLSAYQTAQR